jgi:AraC-like DNA-binding protein
MDSRHPTVTLRFVQAIHQAAGRLGIALPAMSPDQQRVPLAAQDVLWEAFCGAAADPLTGLRLGLEIQAGHLDLTGLLLMSCETYGESLDALLDYYPIVGEGGDFELDTTADDVQLCYQAHYQVRVAERVEAVMAALINLSHWNTGGLFHASRIRLQHRPLDNPDRYQQLLGCPVEFGASHSAILFPRALLELPLIQANATMRDQLRRLADEQLAHLGDDSLAHRVASLLCQQPRWGKEKVAEHLAMSGRHLIRLLAEEGVTFKQIRDRELLRLAQHALQCDVRISDVARQLGFSDESAFAKAFRRWTGTSPAQYRDQPQPDAST